MVISLITIHIALIAKKATVAVVVVLNVNLIGIEMYGSFILKFNIKYEGISSYPLSSIYRKVMEIKLGEHCHNNVWGERSPAEMAANASGVFIDYIMD